MKPPFAIRFLIWIAALVSAAMYLSILLVYTETGPPIMGGERVTRTEWLHIAAPLVAIIGILMALTSYGLATRKTWARHLVVAVAILIMAYAVATERLQLIQPVIMWRAIVNASALGFVSVWYFYLKPSVVEYFRQLRHSNRP